MRLVKCSYRKHTLSGVSQIPNYPKESSKLKWNLDGVGGSGKFTNTSLRGEDMDNFW